jgi:hypothetical protein
MPVLLKCVLQEVADCFDQDARSDLCNQQRFLAVIPHGSDKFEHMFLSLNFVKSAFHNKLSAVHLSPAVSIRIASLLLYSHRFHFGYGQTSLYDKLPQLSASYMMMWIAGYNTVIYTVSLADTWHMRHWYHAQARSIVRPIPRRV